MSALLEVIVTSAEEALEAEAGGADRLELLSAPEHAGLTPSLATVESVVQSVSIPVRVMLRNEPSMSVGTETEFTALLDTAARFSKFPIDGIVAGFIKDEAVDEGAMLRISQAAAGIPITFHRAFDALPDPTRALDCLKRIPQIDRILTHGSSGEWEARVAAVTQCQRDGAPRIKIIFAVGKERSTIAELRNLAPGIEVHVGRAARNPATVSGKVTRERVAAIKQALGG
jgi:copper homeostasis protein